MSSIDTLTGVAEVEISQDDPTVVGSLAAVTMSAALDTPIEFAAKSANKVLSSAETYKVAVGLVGRQSTGKGYTVGITTPLSAALTPAAGQGLKIKILNTDFVNGFNKAITVAIFLQTGSADPQIAGFAYIDPAEDFVYEVFTKPLKKAPSFTSAILTAATANRILGTRSALGVTYEAITPTTGGVRLIHRTSKVTIRPDNVPDFDVVTTRATDIQFSALVADNRHLAGAFGTNYVKFSDGGQTIEQSESDLVSAIASLNGNRAIRLFMPPDANGDSTIRLYMGNLDINQQDVTENTSKTDQLQIDFNLQAAGVDYLTQNLHSTVWHKRY